MADYDFSSLVSLVPDSWVNARGWLNRLIGHIDTQTELIEADLNEADKVREAAGGAATSTFAALWTDVSPVPTGSIVIRKDTPSYSLFEWNGTTWNRLFGANVQAGSPTVNDDANDGYYVGWRWIDTTGDEEYVLIDSTVGAAIWVNTTFTGTSADFILLQHSVASGTDGGSATPNTYNTQPLNTEVFDTGGHCTLSSNQFSLSVGTYLVDAYARGSHTSTTNTVGGRARIRNITDTVTEILGSGQTFTRTTALFTEWTCHVRGMLVVSGSTKTYELQQWFTNTASYNTVGFGRNTGSGENNIFASVFLQKVA